MRSIVRICTTVVLIAGAAASAHAQSVAEANTVTVTPFVGVTFGTSQDLGSSLGIGGAIGYDWTPNLGFEFELGRVFDVAGDEQARDIQLTTITGNVIYHFDVVRVTPYATVGLGWERVSIDVEDPDVEDPDSNTEIAWNFGGGVKIPINSRVLARADLRRFQGNDLAPDHWRLYGGVTFWIKR
jgi:opacity protein-like surface antigen